ARGPMWDREEEEGVAVAIDRMVDELEIVSGGFALGPEALTRAAEERHTLRAERHFERFAIDESEHQYSAVIRVLHYRRQETVAFVPIELAVPAHGRPSIEPCCR